MKTLIQLTALLVLFAILTGCAGATTPAMVSTATEVPPAATSILPTATNAPPPMTPMPPPTSMPEPVVEPTAEINLPLAPESARVDLTTPTFSDPTHVTNPLFPISNLHSALLLGRVDGRPFRVETTLLPDTRTIEWNGQQVETLVSQYVAYLDGRIEEIALDWYAQADDGSVWYFGEDVFNYEDGVLADTDGTWLAGRDGPAAMIMSGNPRIGDVYRPENIPGFVFEEVTVHLIDQTVIGPHGPVEGAIVVQELHMDGLLEEKTFAPGYGEFATGGGSNLEAIALAIPADVREGSLPAELETLYQGALRIDDAAKAGAWEDATAAFAEMRTAWDDYQASGPLPEMVKSEMSGALSTLAPFVELRNPTDVRTFTLLVAQASLDLQLQYRPPSEIDRARFEVWMRQLLADADAGNAGGVAGGVVILERVWERIGHTFDNDSAMAISAQLEMLPSLAAKEDFVAVTDGATELQQLVEGASQ